jgi:hypothetical protein
LAVDLLPTPISNSANNKPSNENRQRPPNNSLPVPPTNVFKIAAVEIIFWAKREKG